MDDPVDPAILDELQARFPDFVRAYEPDGLTPSEFDTFGRAPGRSGPSSGRTTSCSTRSPTRSSPTRTSGRRDRRPASAPRTASRPDRLARVAMAGRVVLTPETAGWRLRPGCASLARPRVGRWPSRRPRRVGCSPLAGAVDVVVRWASGWRSPGGSSVLGRPVRLRLRATRSAIAVTEAGPVGGSRWPRPAPSGGLPVRTCPASAVGSSCAAPAAARARSQLRLADRFEADRLIAVEVLTPGGNWSARTRPTSTTRPARRVRARGDLLLHRRRRTVGPGLAYQQVYGTVQRPIDV